MGGVLSIYNYVTTQTNTKFTEKLTDFDTKVVDSAELFDHACDICDDNKEKEAVGYCEQCRQYLCFSCCKHHEKIKSLKYHLLVARKDFSKFNKEMRLLYESDLVPLSIISINAEISYEITMYIHRPFITGAVYLSNENLVVIYSNSVLCGSICALHHIDNNNSVKEILKTGIIGSICYSHKQGKIFYTIPSKSKIHQLTESTLLSTGSQAPPVLKTSGRCWGISVLGEGLAVSVKIETSLSIPDWQIQFLDFHGGVKKQIFYDYAGKPLFSNPVQLASNQEQNVLYVSDSGNHSIIAINMNGHVLFTFKHQTMQNPNGLTVDYEGNIYVACCDKIVQIHEDGTKSRVILQQERKDSSKQMTCVSFNNLSRKLAVTESSNKVMVFNFLS